MKFDDVIEKYERRNSIRIDINYPCVIYTDRSKKPAEEVDGTIIDICEEGLGIIISSNDISGFKKQDIVNIIFNDNKESLNNNPFPSEYSHQYPAGTVIRADAEIVRTECISRFKYKLGCKLINITPPTFIDHIKINDMQRNPDAFIKKIRNMLFLRRTVSS